MMMIVVVNHVKQEVVVGKVLEKEKVMKVGLMMTVMIMIVEVEEGKVEEVVDQREKMIMMMRIMVDQIEVVEETELKAEEENLIDVEVKMDQVMKKKDTTGIIVQKEDLDHLLLVDQIEDVMNMMIVIVMLTVMLIVMMIEEEIKVEMTIVMTEEMEKVVIDLKDAMNMKTNHLVDQVVAIVIVKSLIEIEIVTVKEWIEKKMVENEN